MSIQAAYSGACLNCDRGIKPLDLIRRDEANDGWVHAICPEAGALIIEREPCTDCFMVPSVSGECGCDR